MDFHAYDAGDIRRAAALLLHYDDGNVDGMNVILAETAEVGRSTQLLLALLELFGRLLPEIKSPLGAVMIGDLVVAMASKEAAQP